MRPRKTKNAETRLEMPKGMMLLFTCRMGPFSFFAVKERIGCSII